MKYSHSHLLRLIALFKLVKAALLIATGIGVFRLVHADVGAVLQHWVATIHLDPGSRFVGRAIERATNLSPHKIRELGIVSFIYASLFLTEGIGLGLLKHWAEWFTIIITGSLVPIEAYEIYRHPAPIKVFVLMLNVAVVAYLVYRIFAESGQVTFTRAATRRMASAAARSRTR